MVKLSTSPCSAGVPGVMKSSEQSVISAMMHFSHTFSVSNRRDFLALMPLYLAFVIVTAWLLKGGHAVLTFSHIDVPQPNVPHQSYV